MPDPFYRSIPNLLTLARLVIAIAFFVILSNYRHGESGAILLDLSIVMFILAAVTDWLDGWLARRWDATSMFGRIMDPVCDKVLVIGAFVLLAGPMFLHVDLAGPDESEPIFVMTSGVYPWMVLIILGRELLVTAIRSMMEARGIAFGAVWSGKAKMLAQVIAIPTILFMVAHLDPVNSDSIRILRDILVYAILIITVVSGWPYVLRAMQDRSTNEPKKEEEH